MAKQGIEGMIDLQKIKSQAQELTLTVGEYIREQREIFTMNEVQSKGLHDLVSYVDITSEKKLVEGLKNILPEAGFITEEGKQNDDKNKYIWVIDPLDGTTNFIHGIPHYCISIALIENNEIVLGMVYDIPQHDFFWAIRHQGSYLNDKKIYVSDCKNLSDALIATGFPVNKFHRLTPYLQLLETIIQNSHGVRRIGTAALDLCYVACGKAEAFYEYGLQPWDVAAGALIVEEAGGKVSDFNNGKEFLFGEEIVASNTHIHETLIATVEKNMNSN
jgi:myo-inositol-1(or 4)-monophosphatase